MFIYGGIFLAAAAAVVARSYCVRRIPLLIVHGLMWAESVGLDFFLARLCGVTAARVLFVGSLIWANMASLAGGQ